MCDLQKNSGKGARGERIKNLGRGSISCRGQGSLEAESVQHNPPPGEWLNDELKIIHVYEILPSQRVTVTAFPH